MLNAPRGAGQSLPVLCHPFRHQSLGFEDLGGGRGLAGHEDPDTEDLGRGPQGEGHRDEKEDRGQHVFRGAGRAVGSRSG